MKSGNLTFSDTIREAMAVALIQLMEKKPFAKITVCEIVQLAGVGRSSFYRNYQSKEDLLFSYIYSLYTDFFGRADVQRFMNGEQTVEEFLLPRFQFIKDNADIFINLKHHALLNDFFVKAEGDLIVQLCGQTDDISPYYKAMFSGSCASIIRLWVERDLQETPQEMVKLFAAFNMQSLK